MDTFYALSAPIRREILDLLAKSEQLTATAIAEKFKVSPPAISQHLKVLLNTSLITMHKQAQQRIYELNPTALRELEAWAQQMVEHFESITNLADATSFETEK